jgi:hypothetical protein
MTRSPRRRFWRHKEKSEEPEMKRAWWMSLTHFRTADDRVRGRPLMRRQLLATFMVPLFIGLGFTVSLGSGGASAQEPSPRPVVSEAIEPGTFSGDVRSLPRARADPTVPHPEGGMERPTRGGADGTTGRAGPRAGDMPTEFTTPLLSFQGINGGNPPDPTGDVGPNHYVQMVNSNFAIYDKAGNTVVGSTAINSLWAGAGGQCEARNDGDPIVVYDQLANRWLLSQFIAGGGSTGMCIAISRTPNPVTGGYNLYEFPTSVLPDYPKFGVWPDAYYMSSYEVTQLGAFAFDRANMLAGNAAVFVKFTLPSLGGGTRTRILPADWDGTRAPPAGAANPFMRSVDGQVNGGADRLEVYQFGVNFAAPATSTFNLVSTLTPAPFDTDFSNCTPGRLCIPQPGTTQEIDALPNRLMWRLQYRNFGTHQAMVVNQTVDFDLTDRAGIRWYELRNTGAGWTIFGQATYSPDANGRFMGSAAMDSAGNLAIGYSLSSASVFPSLRYAGRLATDPLGTLPRGEGTLVAGSGAQTGSFRWGDYSHMSVDPGDDCTFWYVGEFANSTGSFRTQIGAFAFPSCARPDHFKAYEVDREDPRFQRENVLLEDQFGRQVVRVERPELLLNPVEKQRQGGNPEPVRRPDVHLKCYGIKQVRDEDNDDDELGRLNRTVRVSNQFTAKTTIRVKKARSLCTPASKQQTGEPGDPPPRVNHLKCYDVEAEDEEKEEEEVVMLRDQFGQQQATVKRVKQLCNPVSKQRKNRQPEPIERSDGHLVCYEIKAIGGDGFPKQVITRDQFGRQVLRVKKPKTLCVPSVKE